MARSADRFPELKKLTPEITPETNISLLEIMASSMLVIATFAVGSMITAYGSASNTATPRSFPLVISDDTTQTALSSFIGAFIFSIVALVALYNSYYGHVGQFALFVLILVVFAWVIIMFVSWVDDIARLGRLGNTIDKVEKAAAESLARRRLAPTLGACTWDGQNPFSRPVHAAKFGYVQQVDMSGLQDFCEEQDCRIQVEALPGKFAGPNQVLAYIECDEDSLSDEQVGKLIEKFRIGDDRVFDDDPRFGLIVLSEIAGRALSPAVNDPGTAIDILGTLVRLFADWVKPLEDTETDVKFDRVYARALSVADMVDDAFAMILREGAGSPAVAIRLQKSFAALARLDDDALRRTIIEHSAMGLAQCKQALALPQDIEAVTAVADSISDKV